MARTAALCDCAGAVAALAHFGGARQLNYACYLQQCFKDAVDEQPDNPVYKKGLEMTAKAPDLYDEIQKQINPPQPIRQSAKSTFWYDVLGYVTVIGAILAVSACAGAMAGAAQKQTAGTSGVKTK